MWIALIPENWIHLCSGQISMATGGPDVQDLPNEFISALRGDFPVYWRHHSLIDVRVHSFVGLHFFLSVYALSSRVWCLIYMGNHIPVLAMQICLQQNISIWRLFMRSNYFVVIGFFLDYC